MKQTLLNKQYTFPREGSQRLPRSEARSNSGEPDPERLRRGTPNINTLIFPRIASNGEPDPEQMRRGTPKTNTPIFPRIASNGEPSPERSEETRPTDQYYPARSFRAHSKKKCPYSPASSQTQTPTLFLVFLLSLFVFGGASAQDLTPETTTSPGTERTKAVVAGGDTIPNFLLEPVFVTGKLVFKNRRERIRYTKLRRDVLKVLPYAKFAGAKYREMEDELLNAKNEKEQKEIIDLIEQDIKDNFEKDLRKLTITQGKILIKLIDRETGRTSYVLLQELKSRFTAFFWQSIARVFGHDLKERYDPEEEKEIEKVIRSVEMDRYYQLYNGEYYLQVQHRKDQRAKD